MASRAIGKGMSDACSCTKPRFKDEGNPCVAAKFKSRQSSMTQFTLGAPQFRNAETKNQQTLRGVPNRDSLLRRRGVGMGSQRRSRRPREMDNRDDASHGALMRGERGAFDETRRDYPTDAYVFVSQRGGPVGPFAFHRRIQRLGEAAKMPFPIHPHMLRHACGFKLANDGHDTRALQHYLGHKNIQHTVRYTDLAPDRFKNFWRA